MTTEQMIEVMQHYVDGGEVVFTHRGELGRWEVLPKQYIYWNWEEYNYRIKSKAIYKALPDEHKYLFKDYINEL